MTAVETTRALSPAQVRRFREEGFLVVPGLFPDWEVARLRDHFMALHAGGPIPGCFAPISAEKAGDDPLARFPRMMHPHRVDDLSRRYLLDPRLGAIVADLFGEEPLAAQTMLYFKPPGARGQALHQDNFFLKVEPGTCVAAWVALDPADLANGGLEVVPGTHAMDLFCPEEADSDASFTRDYVPPPPGLAAVPVPMAAGDVLFFNGSLVHGSQPNRTGDRFRRSFICHYIPRSARLVSRFYRPILTLAGEEVEVAENTGGGPCGAEAAAGPH